MAKVTPSTVMVEIGMERSYYFPIKEEPAAAKPVYNAALDMGHAVKAALSVTTVSASIPGDNITQVEAEEFVGGQLDAETTMNSLEINAKIYGHTYSEDGGEVSSSNDASPNGGYAFIQHILKKDKTKVFRATCLHKVSAMAGSEKQTANTKTPGSFTFANNAVSYKVMPDNAGNWRTRQDFATLEEASDFITAFYAAAAASAS